MNQNRTVISHILLSVLISIFCLTSGQAWDGIQGTEGLRFRQGTSPPSDSSREDRNQLSLQQCIEKALENNPLVGYGNWKVEEVEALGKQAASQRWPKLRAVGGLYHYSDTQRLISPRRLNYPLIFTDDMFSWNLVLSLPIFTGGRITNEIRAGELQLQSAEYGFDRSCHGLIFNVTSVYFSILKQQKIIEFLDFSRTTLEAHLVRVKELIAAKKAARLDRLRIEVKLADIVQRMEQEKNTLGIQNRSLANLMGMKETDFHIPSRDELSFSEQKIDLEENLDRAYGHRPDYLSAQKDVEVQEKRLSAVMASYWPSLSLVASYGAKKALGSYTLPPGIDSYEDIGQIGCLLELPLFEAGRIKANVQQEKAKLEALRERLREVELNIRLDVETAISNIVSTGKRIEATEKAIEQADETLRIEMEKYDLGKGSMTDIFDAESSLREVKTVHYIAFADYNIYTAQLKFVQGNLE